MGPGCQYGRFKDGVASPVESDELALDSPMDHAGLDPGSGWRGIHRYDLQLSPGTGGIQHRSAYDGGRVGRELGAGDGALGKQHRVIGQIDYG